MSQRDPEKRRTYQKAYRLANKERVRYTATRRAKRQDRMVKLKAGPCVDCGGWFPPEAMDFDHVRGVKVKHVGWLGDGSLARLMAEIEKCELVCANCHRVRTAARRRHDG